MEKAYLQYVSGWMFDAFGLRPAAGRLFTESDDLMPGGHPLAVHLLRLLGAAIREGSESSRANVPHRERDLPDRRGGPGGDSRERSGHGDRRFCPHHDEPHDPARRRGLATDLGAVRPGVAAEPLRQKLAAVSRAFEEERAKGFTDMPKKKRR